jgi:hypothetical protein
MHGLLRVRRVHRLTNVLRVFKVRRQILPLAAPGFDDQRILLTPFGLQLI